MGAIDAVRAANRAYYDAFEQQNLAALTVLWEPSDRTVCTHPGWPTIHGTPAVLKSYEGIFGGPQTLQVILTNEHAMVEGTLAYVTVDENLVDQDGNASATTALNLFAREGDDWLMIGHHGSPIMIRRN